MKAGKLTMIVGPMYSGKTTELLNYVDVYRRGGKSYKIFRIKKDIRYSEREVVSHNGAKEEAITVPDSSSLLANLGHSDHAVFIDEIQFFDESIVDVVKKLVQSGIDVYCSGLDVSFKNNAFDNTGKLLCMAEEIIKKRAVCNKCKEYNATISYKTNEDDNEIDIGGAEKYVSFCRSCYFLANSRRASASL